MKFLVISDTHDNLDVVKKVVNLSKEYDFLIHCGDYVSPFTIRKLVNCGKIYGVWGNNEGDKITIYKLISGTEFSIEFQPREIELMEKPCLLIHGWGNVEKTRKMVYSIAKGGDWKIVFYGHTHIPELVLIKDGSINVLIRGLECVGKTYEFNLEEFDTLILNPGESSGWLYGTRTAAEMYLDEGKIKVVFLKL